MSKWDSPGSSKINMSKPLTARQELFVREYLVDLNASGAYQRAGYKCEGNTAESAASRLLRNVKVKSAIDKALDKRKSKLDLTAEGVLLSIIEVQKRCMQKEPVMIRGEDGMEQLMEFVEDEEGNITKEGVWKFDATNSLKAAELLGKHLKLFTDKLEVDEKSEIRITMDKDLEDWGG